MMMTGVIKPGNNKLYCYECNMCTNCGNRTSYDGKWFCGDSCRIVYMQKQEKNKLT